jgi:hypothetical protein
MRQTTTAKVRLDAGKAARFSASAQSTDWVVSRCARGARFTIAHDGRRGKPWPHSHTESGECRLIRSEPKGISNENNAHRRRNAKIISDPWWIGPCFGAQWWLYLPPDLDALKEAVPDFIYVSHGTVTIFTRVPCGDYRNPP